jgi:hypothetical protein
MYKLESHSPNFRVTSRQYMTRKIPDGIGETDKTLEGNAVNGPTLCADFGALMHVSSQRNTTDVLVLLGLQKY